MLVSACVLPHPPVLVPQLAVRSPDWLVDLRAVCLDSVARLVSAEPEVVVVVGAGNREARWDATAGGSLTAFGVDVRCGGPEPILPLSLTIGAWLLDQVGWAGCREYVATEPSVDPAEAARRGRALIVGRRTAMMAMGDGTAKRTRTAPGYFDERAAAFDAQVVKALVSRDAESIGRLDSGVAEDLWVAGVPAWQVLAGTFDETQEGVVRYDDAPTGVGYFVTDLVVR